MHPCYDPLESGWDGTRRDQANTYQSGGVGMDKEAEVVYIPL